MKRITSLVLLALLGTSLVSASMVKQNVNDIRSKLAQTKAQELDCGCAPQGPVSSGVLTTLESEVAAATTTQENAFEDNICMETFAEEESSTGANDFNVHSCLCHKRKYCLGGEVDYTRTHTQTEEGSCRQATEEITCTDVHATSSYEAGDVEGFCLTSPDVCDEATFA